MSTTEELLERIAVALEEGNQLSREWRETQKSALDTAIKAYQDGSNALQNPPPMVVQHFVSGGNVEMCPNHPDQILSQCPYHGEVQ